MIFVSVIGVEHPFGVAESENCNIWIAVHDFRAKYILLESKGIPDVLNQQIHRQTL